MQNTAERTCRTVTALLCLLLVLGCLSCSVTEDPKSTNIVLIVVDALRPDHLGC
jgi:hypothetical protein